MHIMEERNRPFLFLIQLKDHQVDSKERERERETQGDRAKIES